MVSFCERHCYSTQMACPYCPCHLSKGLHHPYWCGLVIVHAFPLAKSQDEQAMSWACCSQASWGVCSATRHWCSSQIACPYFQCHSSKGFHHRYLDPLVGHRDNHTELGLKWSAFAKGIIIPFKWHVPTGHAIWVRGFIIHIRMLWTDNCAEQACNCQLLRKKSDRQRETSCSSWVFSSR